LSAPQLQSRICAGTPSESQKSLAEADGAVHISPAANAAAAPPTVTLNTLVFIPASFSLDVDGILLPLVALAE
jgi:hypothetical protein